MKLKNSKKLIRPLKSNKKSLMKSIFFYFFLFTLVLHRAVASEALVLEQLHELEQGKNKEASELKLREYAGKFYSVTMKTITDYMLAHAANIGPKVEFRRAIYRLLGDFGGANEARAMTAYIGFDTNLEAAESIENLHLLGTSLRKIQEHFTSQTRSVRWSFKKAIVRKQKVEKGDDLASKYFLYAHSIVYETYNDPEVLEAYKHFYEGVLTLRWGSQLKGVLDGDDLPARIPLFFAQAGKEVPKIFFNFYLDILRERFKSNLTAGPAGHRALEALSTLTEICMSRPVVEENLKRCAQEFAPLLHRASQEGIRTAEFGLFRSHVLKEESAELKNKLFAFWSELTEKDQGLTPNSKSQLQDLLREWK